VTIPSISVGVRWKLATSLFLAVVQAFAQEKAHPCASCHPAEVKTQPYTAMGVALQLPGDQTVLQDVLQKHNKLTLEANGYRYSVESKDGMNTYTVSDGSNSITLPIRYGFGIGGLGQTFVFEYRGHFYESMVSYYTNLDGLAITVGSERLKPRNLVEAMGRETPDDETYRCFECHSSGGTSQGKLNVDSMRPGIDCEHCHSGANAHREAFLKGKTATLPQKLGTLSAEDMSENCGACHRTWSTVVRMRMWGENNVRFQPYRLANSKCFLGNDKRISCTACHNPHTDLVRDDASYDRNCRACHAQQNACPVATRNCVSCHMPKVDLPGAHSKFTDHQIRIVRAGDRYPN
jgi:hypothetical protein